jgi:hypothetical protein
LLCVRYISDLPFSAASLVRSQNFALRNQNQPSPQGYCHEQTCTSCFPGAGPHSRLRSFDKRSGKHSYQYDEWLIPFGDGLADHQLINECVGVLLASILGHVAKQRYD